MDRNLAMIRHERSKRDFPKLLLDGDEYVELALGRAKNSLLLTLGKLAIGVTIILLVLLLLLVSEVIPSDRGSGFFAMLVLTVLGCAAVVGVGLVMVHHGNRIYFTNKRVIQVVVTLPLIESERSYDLKSVRRAVYEQLTLGQRMMKCGSLRLLLDKGERCVFKNVAVTQREMHRIEKLVQK